MVAVAVAAVAVVAAAVVAVAAVPAVAAVAVAAAVVAVAVVAAVVAVVAVAVAVVVAVAAVVAVLAAVVAVAVPIPPRSTPRPSCCSDAGCKSSAPPSACWLNWGFGKVGVTTMVRVRGLSGHDADVADTGASRYSPATRLQRSPPTASVGKPDEDGGKVRCF